MIEDCQCVACCAEKRVAAHTVMEITQIVLAVLAISYVIGTVL